MRGFRELMRGRDGRMGLRFEIEEGIALLALVDFIRMAGWRLRGKV